MKNKKHKIISMNEKLKGEFEIVDRSLIVKLGEDLDHHNAIGLREQADKIIMINNIINIIFDFSATNFMDSSGIGVIMGRYKEVNAAGGSVYVVGISNNVDRIFKLSGLYKILYKYDRVQDALDVIEAKNKNK